MRVLSKLFSLLLGLALVFSAWPVPARAADAARYYPDTGHWVGGRFLSFFDANGGLDQFGYPRTEPIWRDGRLVQYFQRARFESWPENSAPFQVQLGLLGSEVTGPPDPPIPASQIPAPVDPSRTYFRETGHILSGAFRDYFNLHGGLGIFGYPVSEASVGPSGFLIQRFQRARMELHPELPPAYQVSLGLIGDEAIFTLGQVSIAATAPVSSAAPPDAAPLPTGRIVVQSQPGGDIVVAQPDGSGRHVVGQGFDPSWSPDGKRIAYTTWGHGGGIYVVNADGTNRQQVYAGDADRAPMWSPDGQSIAFYRKYQGLAIVQNGQVLTINGRTVYDDFFQVVVLRLADGVTWLPPDQPYHSFSPTWAPDGKSIVFQGDLGLYVAPIGQTPRVIPNTDRNDTTPAYRPNGQSIAFTQWNSDHWDVGTINPDGSGLKLLTYDSTLVPAANNAAATWTSDGAALAFASDRSGSWQLYLMNPDGSGVRPLNGMPLTYLNGSQERAIAWGPSQP